MNFFAILLGFFSNAPAMAQDAPDARQQEFRRLAEKIARGGELEARDATEQLIERVVGPVADALGSLEARPPEEQLRLRRALGRLSAALRVKLWRADLPAEDRKLFDRFAARNEELVERLFDDHPDRRLAALQQIPLEPNTAAGLLIVAKVNDSDGDVAEAALEVAASFADPVVVRGLARFAQDSSLALKSGFYKPGEEDTALALAVFAARAVKILGQAGARENAPAIIETVQRLSRLPQRRYLDLADLAAALGALGDERAAPVLLDFMNERALHGQAGPGADRRSPPDENQPPAQAAAAPRKPLVQTVGDVALLNLLRLYHLQPAAFGFSSYSQEPAAFFGFPDDAAREAAHRAFRIWHEENGAKPPGERKLPATQPAEKK